MDDSGQSEDKKWAASWRGPGREASERHSSADGSGDIKGKPSSASENKDGKPKLGKGYQANRRYDKDRRDKRNEKKPEEKDYVQESSATDTKSKVTSTSQGAGKESSSSRSYPHESSKSSSGAYGKHGNDYKSRSEGREYKSGRKSDVSGRDRDRDRDQGRRKGVSDKDTDYRGSDRSYGARDSGTPKGVKSRTSNNDENGADLLNLLQTSKDTKTSDSHRTTPTKSKPGKDLNKKGKTATDLEAQWQKEAEAKRKREEEEKRKEEEEKMKQEEEKRIEEERIRQEEEKKRMEEEEAQRLKEEEIKSINDYQQEMRERILWKTKLKEANVKAAADRPDEAYFGKLDSSLKKNTAFVKKLKYMTESQKDALTKDFLSLNLTKYIGEVAAAITEAKLKMSDVSCGIYMCSLLHQRYSEFSPLLMENWNRALLTKKDEKIPNPSKFRVDLRFFADLIAVGLFKLKEALLMLANQLMHLLNSDKDEHNNLTIVISFCRHCGDDYAGIFPRKYRLLAEKYEVDVPRSQVLRAERQKACRNLLKDYFTALCKHLEKDHKELKNMEKHNRKLLQTKGELNPERKEKQETAILAFQKLLGNSQQFADLLDENLPDLPEEVYVPETDQMGCDIYHPMKAEFEYNGDSSLFEDEDTRQFYENIPDLKAVIPGILYKDSERASTADTQDTDMVIEEELDVEELEKALNLEMEVQQAQSSEIEKEPDADQSSPTSKQTPKDAAVDDIEPEIALDGEACQAELPGRQASCSDDDLDIASSMKLVLEAFLNSLPKCVNRELIDRAATDFCMNLNTKSNRKKLARAMFTVQRTRYDLLPFYSRLVATLHPCMPDVATDLGYLLKGDFKWHVRKKDQINIESKLKTVRFIGELVKFKMFPKSEALQCMKMLLFDFSHHNIEMACAMLEICGRFLYRSADSHHRTKVYLEVMMRKKAALHFDQRYTTLIENAYYYSNPPDIKQEAKKIRPPMHEYIRKLLFKDLSKITTEKVLRQMRKLQWDDADIRFYASKCLTAIWNIRYNTVHCCANLLAGLASYVEDVAIDVVDGILEDVRIGMEVNHPKYNQRRVSCVKYLGELYNYRMVESGVIFKTLYSFITFGVSLDESVPTPLDPAEHLFRIRLTCVLLDTCGQYFDRGSIKKKLDYFLNYFLRYYWFKRKCSVYGPDHPFPMDVGYTIQDTLEAVRPKMKLPSSYEEAASAVQELEKELLAKIADVLPKFKTETDGDGGLATIQESEETDEMSQGLSQVQMTGDTQDSDAEHDDRTGSQSESQRQRHHHHQDDGEEGDGPREEVSDSEDMMESAGEEEADDQFRILTGGPRRIDCTEDNDFMAEFDKVLADNLQARSQEATKAAQVEIVLPMHIRTPQKPPKLPGVAFLGLPSSPEKEEEEDEPEDGMKFMLMTRKGNKPQFSTLDIPVSENFASKFKERNEAEKAEKERMKRVVLDIHERQEEEDYQEMIASMSRPAMVTLNRERRVRYHHPKGAPDADAIFGSKKR